MAKSQKVQGPELTMAAAELVSSVTKVKADFAERTIYLIDVIDDDMAFEFMVTLGVMDRSDGRIKVVLMSGGGSEPAGWAIYDAIKEARNEIWVDSYGYVWSMAALVMQAGSVRRMSKSCRYMMHAGTMKVGNTDQRNIISSGIECQEQNEAYLKAISDRSGLNLNKVKDFWNQEKYLSASDALQFGLIDAIIPHHEEK